MANPEDCDRRVEYVISASSVDENSDYVVLITQANFPSEALTLGGLNAVNSDGSDICFAYDVLGEDRVPCHVRYVELDADPANSKISIAVKINASATTDTTFYCFYSDSGATLDAADSAFGQYNTYSDDMLTCIYVDTAGSVLDATRNETTYTEISGATVFSKVDGILGHALDSLPPALNTATGQFNPNRSSLFKEYPEVFFTFMSKFRQTGNFQTVLGFRFDDAIRVFGGAVAIRIENVYGPTVTPLTTDWQYHGVGFSDPADETYQQSGGDIRYSLANTGSWYEFTNKFAYMNIDGQFRAPDGSFCEFRMYKSIPSENYINTDQRIHSSHETFSVVGTPVDNINNMNVVFTGLTVGNYIRLEDGSGIQRFYFQASATEETVIIDKQYVGETWKFAVDDKGVSPDTGTFNVVSGFTLPIAITLNAYRRLNGSLMYQGTTDPNITIEFDFVTPQASIVIGDAAVNGQAAFDMVEDALVTPDGMRWHSEVGTVTQYDDLAASGSILSLRDYWRLKSDSVSSFNSELSGYVTSTQNVVVDGVNGDVKFSAAGVSSAIAAIPTNPLLDDDVRLDYLDMPISKAGSVTVGGSIVKQADSFVLTSGIVSSGTYQDTHTRNGVYHVIEDDAGELDFYYDFDVGDAYPTGFSMLAEMQGNNDNATIYVYNWVENDWDVVGQMSGENHFDLHDFNGALFSSSVSDVGVVRLRVAGSGLSGATVSIDQILTGYTKLAIPPDNATIATLLDIAEADEKIRPDRYEKLQKTTKAPLVTKNVTVDGDNIDLVEP